MRGAGERRPGPCLAVVVVVVVVMAVVVGVAILDLLERLFVPIAHDAVQRLLRKRVGMTGGHGWRRRLVLFCCCRRCRRRCCCRHGSGTRWGVSRQTGLGLATRPCWSRRGWREGDAGGE